MMERDSERENEGEEDRATVEDRQTKTCRGRTWRQVPDKVTVLERLSCARSSLENGRQRRGWRGRDVKATLPSTVIKGL